MTLFSVLRTALLVKGKMNIPTTAVQSKSLRYIWYISGAGSLWHHTKT